MQTTVIIFSKNRAMQLDATLRSFFRHCQDPDRAQVKVLYKATDPEHQSSYATLIAEHPAVTFVPETDFKAQLLTMIGPLEFVSFLVDDALFVRSFSTGQAARLLRADSGALGFSLRLGTNTVFNYMVSSPMPPPAFQPVEHGVLKFKWAAGAKLSFSFPLELSSSIYRTADVAPLLPRANFSTPNKLEHYLFYQAKRFEATKPSLYCYETSVAFCNPINKVQLDYPNARSNMTHHYAPDDLNRLFQAGSRIDVTRYDGWVSNSCHQELPLHFHTP